MLINDGGGGDPFSSYDYKQIPSPDLENLLATSNKDVQSVVTAWQHLASHMDSLLNEPALSLTVASKLLDGWTGKAAELFKQRLAQVIDFGDQIKMAAITTGESFAQPEQSFHVATNSIIYSMQDMNQWGGDVKSAHPTWCDEVAALTRCLLAKDPNALGDGQVDPNHYYYVTQDGPVSQMTGEPVPWYQFEYVYGEGLAGVVFFHGDVRPPNATLTSTTNGVYPDEAHTFSWNGAGVIPISGDDIAKNFPNAYQNQLQLMLSQVGGSLYHPQVGKFPSAPKPTWSTSSATQSPSGTPNGGNGLGGPNSGGALTGLGGSGGGLPGSGGGTGTLPGDLGSSGGTGGLPGGGPGGGGRGTGGLPGGGGGLGGGGLPGGGGTTKLAGVGPGGPGGIGPLGGGGLPGAGAGGLGSGGLGGIGGSGGGIGSAAGGGAGALAGAPSGTNGAAMPLMPPMIPPMMGAGQNDNARQRKSWLPDDEDIWGDDGTAVPPVISSDG